MSDNVEDLTHAYLRRIDTKLDRLMDDMADVKIRLTSVEEGQAGLNRRLDRVDARLQRLERQADLVPGLEPR